MEHPLCDCRARRKRASGRAAGAAFSLRKMKKAVEQSATSEANKFDEVLGYLRRVVPGFAQVVVVDRHLDVFSRAWWVLEMSEARRLAVP